MFPTGFAVDSDAGPRCEQMQPDWLEKLKNINLIAYLKGKLTSFQGTIEGVPLEWDKLFEDEEGKIERCSGGS